MNKIVKILSIGKEKNTLDLQERKPLSRNRLLMNRLLSSTRSFKLSKHIIMDEMPYE